MEYMLLSNLQREEGFGRLYRKLLSGQVLQNHPMSVTHRTIRVTSVGITTTIVIQIMPLTTSRDEEKESFTVSAAVFSYARCSVSVNKISG